MNRKWLVVATLSGKILGSADTSKDAYEAARDAQMAGVGATVKMNLSEIQLQN